MPGKNTPARRIDAPLPLDGGETTDSSAESVAPPATRLRERPENLALASVLVRSAVTPEAAINATWESPDGVVVDQYVVQIGLDNTFPDDETTTRYTPQDQPSAQLAALKTGETYYVRVAAISKAFQSEWTDTETETTPVDDVAPGPVSSASYVWDDDLLLSWTNPTSDNFETVQIDVYASNGGALLHTFYSAAGHFTYTIDQNLTDTSGVGDPSLYVVLRARNYNGDYSTQVTLSPTNSAPSAPTVTTSIGFSQIAAWVTSPPPSDFDSYEFVWKNSGGSTIRTANTKAAQDFLPTTSSDTYSVTVRTKDRFGQYSSGTVAGSLTIDTLTISDLRSRIVYSDDLSTSAATLKAALADDNRTSGGITVASNAGWVHYFRADWQLLERLKTVTISASAAGGTTNWYLRTSTDAITWSYFSGPVTSSRILTSVADATAAQAAAVSTATLGNSSASRVDLPSLVEARYVELWLRNTTSSTRVDEFYPRRFTQSDDIEAESIKAINIAASSITADRLTVSQLSAITADLGTITAGTVTGATIQTATSGARVVLSSATNGGLIGYGSSDTYNPSSGSGTYQILWKKTDGKFYFGAGNGVLSDGGVSLAAGSGGVFDVNSYLIKNGSTPISRLTGYMSGSDHYTWVGADEVASSQATVYVVANSPTTYYADVQLTAQSNSAVASLDVLVRDSPAESVITATATNTKTSGALTVGSATVGSRGRLTVKGSDSSISGPHIELITATDSHPQFQLLPYTHDNVGLSFDAYYDGTNWKSSDSGSNFQLYKISDKFSITYNTGTSAGSNITWKTALEVNTVGNIATYQQNADTNAASDTLTIYRRSTGTPAANFAGDIRTLLHSSNNTDRDALLIRSQWATATDASRKAVAKFFISDTAAREGFRIEASGTAAMVGFLGANAVVRQNITGVRTGTLAQLQTVVANLLTGLANLGLITDSTT